MDHSGAFSTINLLFKKGQGAMKRPGRVMTRITFFQQPEFDLIFLVVS
jgi:hypothetical protein